MEARLDEAVARVKTAIALEDGISRAVTGHPTGHPTSEAEHGRGNTDCAKAQLRLRIASDPEAFFAHADTNNDQSLSWDE